jgi:hypothetical protein
MLSSAAQPDVLPCRLCSYGRRRTREPRLRNGVSSPQPVTAPASYTAPPHLKHINLQLQPNRRKAHLTFYPCPYRPCPGRVPSVLLPSPPTTASRLLSSCSLCGVNAHRCRLRGRRAPGRPPMRPQRGQLVRPASRVGACQTHTHTRPQAPVAHQFGCDCGLVWPWRSGVARSRVMDAHTLPHTAGIRAMHRTRGCCAKNGSSCSHAPRCRSRPRSGDTIWWLQVASFGACTRL